MYSFCRLLTNLDRGRPIPFGINALRLLAGVARGWVSSIKSRALRGSERAAIFAANVLPFLTATDTVARRTNLGIILLCPAPAYSFRSAGFSQRQRRWPSGPRFGWRSHHGRWGWLDSSWSFVCQQCAVLPMVKQQATQEPSGLASYSQ